jgi:hypothetical protein
MPVEQIINLAVILGVSLYSIAREGGMRTTNLKLICYGALAIVVQIVLNKIFPLEHMGTGTPIKEALLVSEISLGVPLVVVGYAAIVTGLLAFLKAFLSSVAEKK